MLTDMLKTGLQIEIAEGLARKMAHGPFHGHDQDIEQQPAPKTVAVTIDDEEFPARSKNAVHLRDHTLLNRVMMKTMRRL